jgi:transposase InsO family protein
MNASTVSLKAWGFSNSRPCDAAGIIARAFSLSRAGYYRWQQRAESLKAELELRDQIQRIVLEMPGYGYRRVTQELERRGLPANHKRVLRLMRQDNLLCLRKRGFVRTTDSNHALSKNSLSPSRLHLIRTCH